MKINKMICDHCGKEFPRITGSTYIVIGAAYNYIEVNLCENCFEELCKVVDAFCNEKKEGDKK